ncbi:hypothetical protein BDV38DRAFT_234021 [Aspergillus pseudotamarii]|uniref:Uncharacterized protein n=1 Tax=Aspergillus pseudotamarii TaxID=132259 RepID=A0A5N6T9B1_ASPPS|nr:uncharacterized protein BDV38DRAFT_234021 [Aspergillus pseudotamarii]KAE8142769.1 hypothetical protein BDV38DRAFT_234021 [Aspergillus pseudotamarii]
MHTALNDQGWLASFEDINKVAVAVNVLSSTDLHLLAYPYSKLLTAIMMGCGHIVAQQSTRNMTSRGCTRCCDLEGFSLTGEQSKVNLRFSLDESRLGHSRAHPRS